MSARQGEENLLELIRRLSAEVAELRRQNQSYRRNDVRIGNVLITWNDTTNQVTFKNLRTGGPPVTINVP